MNSLSALFVILGLIVFLHGRQSLETSKPEGFLQMTGGLAGGMLLGLGAKENAVLLPLFSFVVELTLYRRDRLHPRARKGLWMFYLITVMVPIVSFAVYLAFRPDFFLDIYAIRAFSPYERLLTETRVLWFYLSLLLLPAIHRLGLFHDDISISTSLLNPASTLLAVITLSTALVFALVRYRRHPVLSFSILWFLVGHSLESSFIGLEIVYEHRNYLPSIGVFFAVMYASVRFFARFEKEKIGRATSYFPYVIIAVFCFSTWAWANIWQDAHALAEHNVSNHQLSPRANNAAATTSIHENNDVIRAINHTINGIRAAPDEAGFYMDMQIYLAYLASEINANFAKSHLNTGNKEYHFPAIPDSIKVVKKGERIELLYSPADRSIISRLLRTKPISVHGVVTLDNLSKCVVNNTNMCLLLRDAAIEWHTSASDNPNTTREYRALIKANTAKLYANTGDYQRALGYITSSTELVPSVRYYNLVKAEYLIRLGWMDEAHTLLDSIEKSGIPSQADQKTIELLRQIQ